MHIIFEEYQDRLRRRQRKPHTVKLFQNAVNHFERGVESFGTTPDVVEPWQVEEIFAALPLAYGSKRNTLQHVRAAYTYAHKRGKIQLDPTYDVDLGRPPQTDPEIISIEELRAIKAACWRTKPNDHLLFHLVAYTGMRRFEIAKMEWGDVNLKTGFIRVVGKADKLRRVPIHPILGELLAAERYHLGERVIRNVTNDRLRPLAPNLPYGQAYHIFRRTAATSLATNGVPDPVIDQMFGWAPRTIARKFYVRARDEEVQRAILSLYADGPV